MREISNTKLQLMASLIFIQNLSLFLKVSFILLCKTIILIENYSFELVQHI